MVPPVSVPGAAGRSAASASASAPGGSLIFCVFTKWLTGTEQTKTASVFAIQAAIPRTEVLKTKRERKAVLRAEQRIVKQRRAKASVILIRKRREIKERRSKKSGRKNEVYPVPPKPPSMQLRHKIITGMCKDLEPSTFEEAGCAFTPRDKVEVDWKLLNVTIVTRRERRTGSDPIEELNGPVLDKDCEMIFWQISLGLVVHLGNFRIYRLLTRGWLPVSDIIGVWSEWHRGANLSTNAIMFPTPIVQIYNVLPSSRDQLSEILALVFPGPAKPTEEDYVRTPMLTFIYQSRILMTYLKLESLVVSTDQYRVRNKQMQEDTGGKSSKVIFFCEGRLFYGDEEELRLRRSWVLHIHQSSPGADQGVRPLHSDGCHLECQVCCYGRNKDKFRVLLERNKIRGVVKLVPVLRFVDERR
ncbi:hypothetical protein B0H13DRAFT_1880672 [Mycena leptocephala]|nr:hypothetical protein B0H13DRAFT_1880672 [Mycena leptocephala]